MDRLMVLIDILVAALVAWPALLLNTPSKVGITYYATRRRAVSLSMPFGIYLPAQLIMSGLFIAATIMFVNDALDVHASASWNSIIGLLFVNLTLFHYWPQLFFNQRMFSYAAVDSIFLVLTAIAALVMFYVFDFTTSFWIFFPYTLMLMCLAALSINWNYVCYDGETVSGKGNDIKVIRARKFKLKASAELSD
jgi:hypothetical protein